MENFKGSNYSWGLVAKIFHWTLAVFILSQIFNNCIKNLGNTY